MPVGDIVVNTYSDSTIPLSGNNDNCFSQDYCCDLTADCERYKEISEIQYGIHIYLLRKMISGLLHKTDEEKNPFLFFTTELPNVYGKGKTPEEAIENWEHDFHLKFQDIYYKQYWERTNEEQNLYEIFIAVVDIDGHKQRTPVNYQQTGKIINIYGNKLEIEWLDESRDIVDSVNYPNELLNYKVGEYFRADVLYEYGAWKLINICSIMTTCYRDYTDEEINAFLDSLPTTKELPPSKIWK